MPSHAAGGVGESGETHRSPEEPIRWAIARHVASCACAGPTSACAISWRIVSRTSSSLWTAVSGAHAGFVAAVESARQLLEGDATWRRLEDAQKATILRSVGLDAPSSAQIGTNDELRRSLDARSLRSWSEQADAVPQRIVRALAEAAALVEPTKQTTTVVVRRGTLATEADVRTWLAEHERRFLEAVRIGPVIVS